MKDFNGTEIVLGSHIVYPGRQGSSIWMNRAVVTGFGETARHGHKIPVIKAVSFTNDGELGTKVFAIHRIDNVVVVSNTQ